MRMTSRTVFSPALLVGGILLATAGPARAQGELTGRSLGGYGANSLEAMSRPGGGSLIPYAGGFGGFMPYRMAGGGTLAFRPRPGSTMDPVRSSFSLSSMSGGMGAGSRSFPSTGSRGVMGSSMSMRRRTTPTAGMGVMPPSFAYPFRQPPSPGSTSGGMLMSMP
jgi:hypothetical protein